MPIKYSSEAKTPSQIRSEGIYSLESRYSFAPEKLAVFCGPSISADQVSEISSAIKIFPPIERGMLQRAIDDGYKVIGIIDGTFINRPTLGARELIEALRNGIVIYGAASLGALRAVEFQEFGMQGIGTIYSWYRHGLTIRDDEVVVPMHPVTSKALCDPLINLRYACLRALNSKTINEELSSALLLKYQSYFYQERRYQKLFRDMESDLVGQRNFNELKRFESYVSANADELNIKLKDSVALVRHMIDSHFIETTTNEKT